MWFIVRWMVLLQLRSAVVFAGDDDADSQSSANEILKRRLAEQLGNYEVLPHWAIASESPLRMKRRASLAAAPQVDKIEAGIVQVKFSALGRSFHLYLTQDSSVFGEGFEAVSVGSSGLPRRISVSARNFYSGHVAGDGSSRVHARWEGEALVARIQTEENIYYVEPLSRILDNDQFEDAALVYRMSDLKFPADNSTGLSKPSLSCGGGVIDIHNKRGQSARSASKQFHDMHRRSLPSERNTCSLLVIADYTYFSTIADRNENVATNQMIDMVSRVDKIYRTTDFGGGFVNMGFSIKKVIVHTEPSSDQYHYNSEESTTDPNYFLDILANYSSHKTAFYDYCLVHLFTARPHFKGVLGMAYISVTNYSTGICASYRLPPLSVDTPLMNCGYTTRIARDNKILDGQAEVVLAHELGHNWGSDHDPDTLECGPDRTRGSYIMHTYSSPYIQANSKIFSECSKMSIREALNENAEKCFQVAKDLLRGNYRVDSGEACDAGILGDACCSDAFQLLQGEQSCSDVNSVCCKNCSAKAASGITCRYESQLTCLNEAVCNGVNTTCPESYKEVGTKCLPDNAGRCIPRRTDADTSEVHCAMICETIGLRGCLCRDASTRCRVCCQQPEEPCTVLTRDLYDSLVQPCTNDTSKHCRKHGSLAFDAYTWDADFIAMKPNAPCAIGYCDSEGICQKQTQDRLASFLKFLSHLTPSQAVQFMRDNIVGTIVTFSLILWLPCVLLIRRMDRRWERQQSMDMGYSELNHQSFYIEDLLSTQALPSRNVAYAKAPKLRLLSSTARQIYIADHQSDTAHRGAARSNQDEAMRLCDSEKWQEQ